MQVGSSDRCMSPDLPGYESDDDAEDNTTDGPVVPPSYLLNERAVRLEQQHAGQIIFTPGSTKLLIDMLDEVYTQLQPKSSDWDARKTVIQFITKFVNHKIPGSSISAFGSFLMDLFTSSSDLDLSLNLPDGRRDRSRNDKVHFLRKVASALYGLQNGQRQSVRGIETVYRAAVPVVKFVECKTGIECDISVENNDGVLKSRVLGMFSTIDSRFRQLCYLVKAWAKKHNVNSSKNGTLNSLSICLLVAFHLQTCAPPILPPFSVFMEGLYLPAIGSCLETVESRVREFKNSGFGKDNTESVPELFGSFFIKLIAVESLWEQGLCSSTYEGKWISKIWPKNHIGCISVEDFADRSQNVARSVSRKEFELIYQVLQSTVSNLKDPVFDVPEAKDLKAYLFGSIKQRHRGLDHNKVMALNVGNWRSGNWSRTNTSNRGHHLSLNESIHTDWTLGHAVSPLHTYHSQALTSPGYKGYTFTKVESITRMVKGPPANTIHGETGGVHQVRPYASNAYRMQYPPLDCKSNPVASKKQIIPQPSLQYRDLGPGYIDHVHGREDQPDMIAELDPSFSGDRIVNHDINFPTMDPEPARLRFMAVEPVQARHLAYTGGGARSKSHHSNATSIPSGSPPSQRPQRYRRGRGRTTQSLGSAGVAQQYGANGYQVHFGGNGHWQGQPPPNHQFLIR